MRENPKNLIYPRFIIIKMSSKEYLKAYYQANKEKAKQYAKDKRAARRQAIAEGTFQMPTITYKICTNCEENINVSLYTFHKNSGTYHNECNSCRKLKAKQYRLKNKEAVNIRERSRGALRRKCPQFRRTGALRKRLGVCFKKKTMHTFEYLGMNIDMFDKWIQFAIDDNGFNKGLTLENYGSVWELDHIIPCALFDMTNEEEVKMCFHWSNIQPLKKELNSGKRDKLENMYVALRDYRVTVFTEDYPDLDQNQTMSITTSAWKLAIGRWQKRHSIVKTSACTGQSAAKHLTSSTLNGDFDDYGEGSETKQVSARRSRVYHNFRSSLKI